MRVREVYMLAKYKFVDVEVDLGFRILRAWKMVFLLASKYAGILARLQDITYGILRFCRIVLDERVSWIDDRF